MKLKTIAKLAKDEKHINLYDKTDKLGVVTQWAYVHGALYPINGGVPYMDEIALCELLDIADKQRDAWTINCSAQMPDTVPAGDIDEDELPAEALPLTVGYADMILRPVRCRETLLLVQDKYLAAVRQEQRSVELFVRQMHDGTRVVAIKTGLLLQGIVLPVSAEIARLAGLMQSVGQELGWQAEQEGRREE